jgi:hypothetical protein
VIDTRPFRRRFSASARWEGAPRNACRSPPGSLRLVASGPAVSILLSLLAHAPDVRRSKAEVFTPVAAPR